MTATHSRQRASQLDRDRILQAATDVARREGTSALTMARVGSEIGARAASLYYHIGNREELIQGIVDRAGESVNHPAASPVPETEVRNILLAFYDCLRCEAWLVPHLIRDELKSDAVMPLVDRAQTAFRAMGLTTQDAEDAFAALLHYCYGEVLVVDAAVKTQGPNDTDYRRLFDTTVRRYLQAVLTEVGTSTTS